MQNLDIADWVRHINILIYGTMEKQSTCFLTCFFAHDINIDKLLLVAALVESLGRLEYGIRLFKTAMFVILDYFKAMFEQARLFYVNRNPKIN